MKKVTKGRVSTPFAHLMGLNARAESNDGKVDDEDKDRMEGESDEDYAKRMESEETDKKDDDKEDKLHDSDAEGSDLDDDGDDDEKEEKDAVKKAIHNERARCARIIAHGLKSDAIHVACTLAFDSGLNVAASKAMVTASLKDRPAKSASLSGKMSGVKTANPGAGNEDAKPSSTAERIVAIGQRVRGVK